MFARWAMAWRRMWILAASIVALGLATGALVNLTANHLRLKDFDSVVPKKLGILWDGAKSGVFLRSHW